MTTNGFARAGLFLLGAYLIVAALVSATGLFTRQPIVLRDSEAPVDLVVVAVAVLGGALSVALFGLLPGWILISRSRRWADRWFPADGQERSELAPSALYAVGLVLLGIHLVIGGLSGLLAGAVNGIIVRASDLGPSVGWWEAVSLGDAGGAVAVGVVRLLGGLLLCRLGLSYAKDAG